MPWPYLLNHDRLRVNTRELMNMDTSDRKIDLLENYTFGELLEEIHNNVQDIDFHAIERQFLDTLADRVKEAKELFYDSLDDILDAALEDRTDDRAQEDTEKGLVLDEYTAMVGDSVTYDDNGKVYVITHLGGAGTGRVRIKREFICGDGWERPSQRVLWVDAMKLKTATQRETEQYLRSVVKQGFENFIDGKGADRIDEIERVNLADIGIDVRDSLDDIAFGHLTSLMGEYLGY